MKVNKDTTFEKKSNTKINKKNIFIILVTVLMLFLGFAISKKIRQNQLERYQSYDAAAKIDSTELFEQGIAKNVGLAFVYGELKAIDTVSYPEISGEYSYIKKEIQHYRKHSRTVEKKHKDSKGKTYTTTETEYYWKWDTTGTVSKTATKISFLGVEFDYKKIPFPRSHKIDIITTGFHERTIYYGTETSFQGTLFTSLNANTINESKFYQNQTISETIKNLKSGFGLFFFWIAWIFIMIVVVVLISYS